MVAVLVLDGRLRCQFINNVAEFLVGLANAQTNGRHVGDLLWRGREEFAGSGLGRALLSGGAGEGEDHLIGNDGSRRRFAFKITLLDGGKAQGAVLELLDLSGETGTSRALRESEQRLRLAVEAAMIGIWDVDAVHGARRWSPEFNAILGLPVDFQADHAVFQSLIHADDRERAAFLYSSAYSASSDGTYNAEFRIRRADTDEVRWVRASGRVTFAPDGTPLRGIGTLRDVDDRRKGEEALSESERRLRVALVAGRMGAWRYDLKTGLQQWDETQYRLLGLDPSLPPSRELFLSVVHPDDIDLVEFDVNTLPLDAYLDSEFRVIRPNGETRWISAHSIARADPDGTPVEMIGVNRDITAQKEAEEALRVSEERQRLAVEANDVGTWDYDLAAADLRCSVQFRRLWGLSADATVELETLRRQVDATDWEVIRERWSAACDPAGDGRLNVEIHLHRADDGAARWATFSGRVFFDDARRVPLRAVGVMLDTTERREAEERQRLVLRELNHRVKNNLAVVQAIVSQTLRSSPKPTEAFERIQGRLMALSRTHDFLNMSDVSIVPLGRLIENALEPYQSPGPGRIQASGPPIRLASDEALLLGLVFHELATNAAKYGALSSETGRLTVSWRLADDSADIVLVDWIEDGGPPPPSHRRVGFGTRLIDGSIKGRLGGSVTYRYLQKGLHCDLSFRLPPQ